MSQSDIYVMWDQVASYSRQIFGDIATIFERFNHSPRGANVLYLDGHVDFVRYNSEAPATEAYAHFMGGFGRWKAYQ